MELKEISKEVRKNILLQIYSAQSGHPGGALSCADILTTIYFKTMNDGDKFVLSKGHASAALYAVLAEKGIIAKEELTSFRKLNSKLQGHPSLLKLDGVDVSSGSLGQGLSVANGMALAFKLDKKENNVYVILGDGEIQEGQVWEAMMTASHYNLNNVIAFLDYNKLQIDGSNDEVMKVAPVKEKFESFGWYVQEIDGHNFDEINNAIENAKKQDRPSMIVANTIKGKGISFMENQCAWHGKAPNQEQYEQAIAELSL
ncbi:MAG: transketolase [Clostridia bacterium]|nr:transketolase [Clostridia bacterium]